ncbi:hypothetical protein M9H77_12736 [Catharanthus roseus]|uniref:Uncharacterized protein n=1 Tax=Catharanthus roseus TaxID=4058 RepID=A0ACC0BIE7_CATRO|nr:hypothetical protein M9H77_12736 [Catharanthus roseus]
MQKKVPLKGLENVKLQATLDIANPRPQEALVNTLPKVGGNFSAWAKGIPTIYQGWSVWQDRPGDKIDLVFDSSNWWKTSGHLIEKYACLFLQNRLFYHRKEVDEVLHQNVEWSIAPWGSNIETTMRTNLPFFIREISGIPSNMPHLIS